VVVVVVGGGGVLVDSFSLCPIKNFGRPAWQDKGGAGREDPPIASPMGLIV